MPFLLLSALLAALVSPAAPEPAAGRAVAWRSAVAAKDTAGDVACDTAALPRAATAAGEEAVRALASCLAGGAGAGSCTHLTPPTERGGGEGGGGREMEERGVGGQEKAT
ncbi:hypothetical protein, partial [Streptomyces specialis]|uniref:hypothetical protein n=1 Tax=Streptomyces specialis TaxID=498367 RepID=UPI000AFB5A69